MNLYELLYFAIVMFAFSALSPAGRVFGAGLGVWRGRLTELLVRNVLIGIGIPLFFEWLTIYWLITTPPDALAAPLDGYVAIFGVIFAISWLAIIVRETRYWIAWIENHRGMSLIENKRYLEALAVYERLAHMRHPRWPDAWGGKAVALYWLGRGMEALAAIDRAVTLAPRQAGDLNWKARILIALQRDAEALAALNQALTLAPRAAGLWARQGYALIRLGHFAEALAACERALDKTASNSDSRSQGVAIATMAAALNGLGRSAEALAAAERAIALNPYPIHSWLAKAIALERLGRPEEARGAAEQGLGVAERYLVDEPSIVAGAEIWSVKAALLHLLGRGDEAQAAVARSQALYATIRGEVAGAG